MQTYMTSKIKGFNLALRKRNSYYIVEKLDSNGEGIITEFLDYKTAQSHYIATMRRIREESKQG